MISPVKHNRQSVCTFVCGEAVRGALPANSFFAYTASIAGMLQSEHTFHEIHTWPQPHVKWTRAILAL